MRFDISVQRGNYKQYHTSLKLFISAAENSALSFDLAIPRSTISAWKKTDFSKLITHPITGSCEKDLMLFRKFIKDRSAQRLFNTYSKISDAFHSIIKGFGNSINSFKETILPVIEASKYSIGIARTLKIFRVSRQRYDN